MFQKKTLVTSYESLTYFHLKNIEIFLMVTVWKLYRDFGIVLLSSLSFQSGGVSICLEDSMDL